MKLTRLKIHNIGPHQNLDMHMVPGITCITGQNGSGKSFIVMAIRAALSGSLSRYSGDVQSNSIKFGEESGVVSLEGIINGKTFEISRELSRASASKCKLLVDSKKITVKAKEIDEWLIENTGVSGDMLQRFSIINQNDISAFIEQTDAERAKRLSFLANTEIYEKARVFYGDLLKQDASNFEAVGEQTVETLKNDIAGLQQSLSDEKAKIPSEDPTKELDVVTGKIKALNGARGELKELFANRAQYKALQGKVAALATKKEEQRQKLEAAIIDSEAAAKNLKPLIDTLPALEEDIRKASQKRQLEEHLSRIPVPRKPAQEYSQKDTDEVVAEAGALREKYRSLDEIKKMLGTHAVSDSCPLCGAGREHWGIKIDALDSTMKEIQEQLVSKNTHIAAMQTLEKSWKAYNEASNQRDQLLAQIDSLGPFDSEAAAKKSRIEAEKNRVRALAESVRIAEVELESIGKQAEVAGIELDNVLSAGKKLSEKIQAETGLSKITESALSDVETQIGEAESRQSVLLGAKGARERALGVVAALESELKKKESQLSDAQRKLSAVGPFRSFQADMTKAIDWLKRDRLPKLVHNDILQRITEKVNKELGLLGAPFLVASDENLGFEATFQNGLIVNAKSLSGGQKTLLSLAFHWTVSQMFAENLGLLILDEPAAALDDEANQLLYESLERWRVPLRERGHQIIMVTHDHRVSEFCDYQVKL